MKTTSWICWLFAVCICLSEAKSKIRRPLSPPYAPTLILKKPRPINQRISMGNTIHISGSSLSHQRIPYKPLQSNYRIRRPIYNVLSTSWKNQIPMRAISLNRPTILPQRAPTKEFYSINKIPEYSPEYRPELIVPPTHRGDVDDDKGPIHTIPAPNLSLADKPPIRYDTANAANLEDITADHRPYSSDFNYHIPAQNPRRTTFGLATVSSNLSSQQGTVTSLIPPQRNQYEVTESNDMILKEHETVQPTIFQPKDLDVTRLYSIIINNPQLQSNELFASHPINSDTSIIGPNVQFGQSNMPMQTNLHSSRNVGFSSTAIPQTPYTIARQDLLSEDLNVNHPTSTAPPLSASQLYSLLNNFPHKLAEQYTTDQQHILQQLQQQLGQTLESDATSFSQPQLHSFNYDEQTNQLQQWQQQQILSDQDYTSESVTADYNLDPESSVDIFLKQNDKVHSDEELTYPISRAEQSVNNIEYEEITQRNPTTYLDKVTDNNVISTRFYTTLPSREAAEKLAALAAAGNVNSRLIGQLRKQQKKDTQKDEVMPFNHKNDYSDIVIQHDKLTRSQTDDDQQQNYQPKSDQNMKISQQHRRIQSYSVQNDEKSPLQITVPDESDYVTSDDDQNNVKKDDIEDIEYDYENENENENENDNNDNENKDGKKIEDIQSVTLLDDSRIESFDSRLHS